MDHGTRHGIGDLIPRFVQGFFLLANVLIQLLVLRHAWDREIGALEECFQERVRAHWVELHEISKQDLRQNVAEGLFHERVWIEAVPLEASPVGAAVDHGPKLRIHKARFVNHGEGQALP